LVLDAHLDCKSLELYFVKADFFLLLQPMIDSIIKLALKEDIGEGDHTSLSCVPASAIGHAKLIVKDTGILAGVELAKRIFNHYDPTLEMKIHLLDGAKVKPGDIAFEISGKSQSILATERVVLNFMQRMSGIATQTRSIVDLIEGTNTQLLDTRKTTPGIRALEKWAVTTGGGVNHRFGLYDMVMIKDNHIDYAGGITNAILRTVQYLKEMNLKLNIEIEVRDEKELDEVLAVGQVDRIMLDNFTPEELNVCFQRYRHTMKRKLQEGLQLKTLEATPKRGLILSPQVH
jgi:nicotinate-nucleotide pyrophosphorylase (carboxylating)